MKIITLHTRINPNRLREHIRHHLAPMFRDHRRTDAHFDIKGTGNIVEIFQPDLDKDFQYRIEVKGPDLHITRSEHYVDDVDSLTVESILNDLFKDLSGTLGTDLLQEG